MTKYDCDHPFDAPPRVAGKPDYLCKQCEHPRSCHPPAEDWTTSNYTRAFDLRESADDAERLARRFDTPDTPGVAQILRERAERLRRWADELGPDDRSATVAMNG